MMGSAPRPPARRLTYLAEQGEKVGVVKVHLYRPFSVEHLLKAIPASVQEDRRA